MSLSVCFLTRNEERSLDRALGSVAGLADQLIVADTGSTDRTLEIAGKFGAEISRPAWQDDFAAARNVALGQSRCDWILWLNPDEEVPFSCHHIVRACMATPDVFAWSVLLRHLVQTDRPDYYSETWDLRLFRRHPDLRYIGRLHPDFSPTLVELAKGQHQDIRPSQVFIQHHGYLSEVKESKLRWAVRLLELELQDRPGQLPYLIEYGLTLLQLKDAKGHAVLAESAAQVLPKSALPKSPHPDVQLLLEYLMNVSPKQNQSQMTPGQARELAMRWFPHSPPLLWVLAAQSFQAGSYPQAAELLKRLVRMGQKGDYDKSRGFDPRILGDEAVMNLGACHWRLGELDQAEQCFRQLLGSRSHQVQAAQNLALVNNARQGPDAFYSSLMGRWE